MKRAIVFLICFSLVLSSCRTWFPIRPDDHTIDIEIRDSFLRRNTDKVVYRSSGGGGGGGGNFSCNLNVDADCDAIIAIVAVILVVAIVVCIVDAVSSGRDIYVRPAGYGGEYRQQMYPGHNRVFLPRDFALCGGVLEFTVVGTHRGSWQLTYRPGKELYVLD